MKKKILLILIAFIVGIIVSLTISTTAADITASQVIYTNNNQATVSGALDDLMDQVGKCPVGYTCTKKPKCKRATTLHTVYGSLGSGTTLNAGDAFDCDVNGDDDYNASNERFYYVSDLSSDSDYVVLIYSNYTYNGEIDNLTRVAYSSSDSSFTGPDVAKTHLPKRNQWKNVQLSSKTRNVTDESGTTRTSNFSYAGYAARLITYQELLSACPTVTTSSKSFSSDDCGFLSENGIGNDSSKIFGYWFENYRSGMSSQAWVLDLRNKRLYAGYVTSNSSYAVRPVIEVLKEDIVY